MKLVFKHGTIWSRFTEQMEGRSELELKNRYHGILEPMRKRVLRTVNDRLKRERTLQRNANNDEWSISWYFWKISERKDKPLGIKNKLSEHFFLFLQANKLAWPFRLPKIPFAKNDPSLLIAKVLLRKFLPRVKLTANFKNTKLKFFSTYPLLYFSAWFC